MKGLVDDGNWVFSLLLALAISIGSYTAFTAVAFSGISGIPQIENYGRTPMTQNPPPKDQTGSETDEELAKAQLRELGLILIRLDSGASIFNIFLPIAGLALLYIPATLFLASLLEPIGKFGLLIRRDYGIIFNCTLMAWAASHLVTIPANLFSLTTVRGILIAVCGSLIAKIFFSFLMIHSLRALFGMRYSMAVITVCISWISLLFQFSLICLASPFALYIAYILLRGDVGDVMLNTSGQQNFKRNLEAATINPRDSEAHYQLGLIYLQRRQYAEASLRFTKAIEIDPDEIDAQYQLGRIARQQGRLQDAINFFNEVVSRDDRHAQNEVWREIGATYFTAVMYEDARDALEKFIQRREHDPEGLYLLGETLRWLADNYRAREMYIRCLESVKTMPYFRRSEVSTWGKLAEKKLNELTQVP